MKIKSGSFEYEVCEFLCTMGDSILAEFADNTSKYFLSELRVGGCEFASGGGDGGDGGGGGGGGGDA